MTVRFWLVFCFGFFFYFNLWYANADAAAAVL